jgi:hypothetical protein
VVSFRFLSVETIGDRIKQILNEMEGPERGKQTRLAEIADCTKGLINQLLHNPGQQLGFDYAKNIERKLGYRVDWILHGQQPPRLTDQLPLEAAAPPANSANELIEIVEVYRDASPTERQQLLAAVRILRRAIERGRRGGA